MQKSLIAILLIFCSVAITWTQNELCGTVFVDKVKQSGVKVQINQGKDSTITDSDGRFCFSNLPKGKVIIKATFLNHFFKVDTIPIQTANEDVEVHIQTPYLYEELLVIQKSQLQQKKEQSIKSEIIELEAFQRSSLSVEELVNSAPGIKVRNSGGLGSLSDMVIGAYSGSAIKFLLNGIPIDYLGSSRDLTRMPTNMANHIEVYKGVMPPHIAIDALGAAINIVTKTPRKTSHQLSYELGSFNTHRVSLNSFIRWKDKLSFGANIFGNYAKNNFEVDRLPILDVETGKTKFITAPLFNNGYQQWSGEVYFNIENTSWADLFTITLNSYGIHRELQNDMASRSKPYGKVYRNEFAYVVPSLYYKKSFADKRLNLTQFLVFSKIYYEFADTVKNGYYDWLGNRHSAISGNETGTNLSNLSEPIIHTLVNNFTYRGMLSYDFNDNNQLILNVVDTYLKRIADDLGAYRSKEQFIYNRFIAALGYRYFFFDKALEGVTQIKLMSGQTQGEQNNLLSQSSKDYTINSGFSFSQALKYQIHTNWMVRASVENTFRLPSQSEIFGDNVFIIPNLNLKPEQSFNINLGVGYHQHKKLSFEINTFLRDIQDMIRIKEITQFQSQFLNLDHVSGYGIELQASYFPIEQLELSGNITYNEYRFRGSNNNIAQNDHFINARVSNMPFYFGNASMAYTFENVWIKKSELKLYWRYSYVHQYYLDFIEKQYEPEGFLGLFGQSKVYTDRVIPIQHVHSGGFVWTKWLDNGNVMAVAGAINNVFDEAIYNNFKMQSAGRNLSLKLTYEF